MILWLRFPFLPSNHSILDRVSQVTIKSEGKRLADCSHHLDFKRPRLSLNLESCHGYSLLNPTESLINEYSYFGSGSFSSEDEEVSTLCWNPVDLQPLIHRVAAYFCGPVTPAMPKEA